MNNFPDIIITKCSKFQGFPWTVLFGSPWDSQVLKLRVPACHLGVPLIE